MFDETSTACRATKRNGQPCQAHANGSGYCWAHDPSLRERRQQARRDGGKARHGRRIRWSDDNLIAGISIRNTDDVLALLERVIVDEMRLENSHNRNRAVASLAMAALKALEVGEFEARLAALEAALESNK